MSLFTEKPLTYQIFESGDVRLMFEDHVIHSERTGETQPEQGTWC
jgi:hypothetical protein